jgi:arsenate reductase (thioredoxin)
MLCACNAMSEGLTNILILCTGNSARSILGEAILTEKGKGRIVAYSAGSKPKGVPHPGALRLLARRGIDPSPFRSNLAITVCGNAAGEACPLFLGAPLKAHWGLTDPADVEGDDAAVDAAFEETWRLLTLRVSALLALPFETMERDAFKATLAEIGEMEGAV